MQSSAASWVYLVSVLAPVCAAIVLALHYPQLPKVIPVHFTAAGEADGFAEKSWPTVLGLPVIALALTGMFLSMEVVRRRAWDPQPVDVHAERAVPVPFSRSAHLRAHHQLAVTNRWLAWLGLAVSVGMSMLAVGSLVPGYGWMFTPALGLVLLGTVVITVVGMVLTFRAQSRAKEEFPPDGDEAERNRLLSPAAAQREVYRFGGFVYANPADPMAIGPSYVNSGNLDMNLAHPPGASFYRFLALFLGVIILLPIVMIIL